MKNIEILKIRLKRNLSQIDVFEPKFVKSVLLVTFTINKQFRLLKILVRENRDYVFPDGIYDIKFEYSPKFRKKLWEFYGIDGRTEIKFHSGNEPEHTLGCPLRS